MSKPSKRLEILLALFLWGLVSALALKDVDRVPFHPDESTYIYMSRDLELLVQDGMSLAWQPDATLTAETRYRLIDAPLARYIIGVARWLFNVPSLPADWDWGKSWEENQAMGALPSSELLKLARQALTSLLPLSLLFLYLTVKKVFHPITTMAIILLMGSHALILVHARRSMAEGALLLGLTFTLWSFTWIDKHPGLAGLAMAVAINAKHSSLALLPIGLLTIIFYPSDGKSKTLQRVRNALVYLVVVLGVTFALNPIYWKHPFQAALASLEARKELLTRQTLVTENFAPEGVADTLDKRFLVLIANLFIQPPYFYEVGNYAADLQVQIDAYIRHPYHRVCRDLFCGGFSFALASFGFLMANPQMHHINKRAYLLRLWWSTFAMAVFILATIPLPWQRYVLPMIPFAIIWMAYGAEHIIRAVLLYHASRKKAVSNRSNTAS